MKGKIARDLILVTALFFATPAAGMAGWNVSIGIGVPLPGYYYYTAPPLAIMPPPVAVVPVLPSAPGPAYFFGGLWYTLAGGRWFFSAEYSGPWSSIAAEKVPPEVNGAPVYQAPGQAPDGRYIPPRLYYGGEGW